MNERDPRLSVEEAAIDAAWRSEMPAVDQSQTSVTLPEGGEMDDPGAVSDRLSEDLGVEVDLQFEDADYLSMMESELRRLDSHGLLQNLNYITDVPDRFDHDLKDRASGLYNTATQELYVAPEEVIGEEPRERQGREGYFSTDKNFGSVWHELGHHWVREANPDGDFTASEGEDYWGQEIMQRFAVEEIKGWDWDKSQDPGSLRKAQRELTEKIEDDVSEYAGFGGMEFVAETFAGLVAGNEYPEWVTDLYDRMGGYTPPSESMDPETAYVPMVAPGSATPVADVTGAAAAGAVEAAVAQSGSAFENDADVREVATAITQRTPATISEAEYMGYFDDPTVWVRFGLPSSHPATIYRDHFDSALTAEADTGRMKEVTIRFPAIEVSDADEADVREFVEDINPDGLFRVRVQEQTETQGGQPEYHPHLHYSAKKRGESGPPVQSFAADINRAVRAWYDGVGRLFEAHPAANFGEVGAVLYRGSRLDVMNQNEFSDRTISGGSVPVWWAEMPESVRDATKEGSSSSKWSSRDVDDALGDHIVDRDEIEITGGMTDALGTGVNFQSPGPTEIGTMLYLDADAVSGPLEAIEYTPEYLDENPGTIGHVDSLADGEVFVNDEFWGTVDYNDQNGLYPIFEWGDQARDKITYNRFISEREVVSRTGEVDLDGSVMAVASHYHLRSAIGGELRAALNDLPGYSASSFDRDTEWTEEMNDREVAKALWEETVQMLQWPAEDYWIVVRDDDRLDRDSDAIPREEFMFAYNGEHGVVGDYDAVGLLVGKDRTLDPEGAEEAQGDFGEWAWSRDKAGLKECEAEMEGEVDNQYAFCRAWANEAGVDTEEAQSASGWRDVTEHDVWDDESWKVADEAGEWIAQNTGVGEVIFLNNPDHARQIGNRILTLDGRHDLSAVDLFSNDMPIKIRIAGGDAVGAFVDGAGDGDELRVYVRPLSFHGPPQSGSDWLATDDRYQTVVHEFAHYLHYQNIKTEAAAGTEFVGENFELTEDQRSMIEDEVSEYAAVSGIEAVAEIATGVMYGEEYPDAVMDVYRSLHGPRVGDVGFDRIPYDQDPPETGVMEAQESWRSAYLAEAEVVEETFSRLLSRLSGPQGAAGGAGVAAQAEPLAIPEFEPPPEAVRDHIEDWFHQNEQTYRRVWDRLDQMRSMWERLGHREKVAYLQLSATFSIYTMRVDLVIAEAAFRKMLDGATIEESLGEDLPGIGVTPGLAESKADWIQTSLAVDGLWDEAVRMLDQGKVDSAHKLLVDRTKGLGSVKAAFTLANLGFVQKMCIDGNVARLFGATQPETVNIESYEGICTDIQQMVPDLSDELAPYELQWLLFDWQRTFRSQGGQATVANENETVVATHDEWFDVALGDPGTVARRMDRVVDRARSVRGPIESQRAEHGGFEVSGEDPPAEAMQIARGLADMNASRVSMWVKEPGEEAHIDFELPLPGDDPIRSGAEVRDGHVVKATLRYGVLDPDEYGQHPTTNHEMADRLRDAVRQVDPPSGVNILCNFGDTHYPPRPHVLLGWEPSVGGVVDRTVQEGENRHPIDPGRFLTYVEETTEAVETEFLTEYASPSNELKTGFASPIMAAIVGATADEAEALEFEESAPEEFSLAIGEMIEDDPEMGAFLTYHPPNELSDHTLLQADDGRVGVAVSPEGDVQNLYNNGGPQGAGTEALQAAIEAGGCTLDAYDGFLRDLYANYGFRETGRIEFDPEYAPEGWNMDRFGHPDVVFMAYKPESLVLGETDDYYAATEWDEAKADALREADCDRST